MAERSTPPAAALAILGLFASNPDLAAIIGDMSEEFHDRRTSSGPRAATSWFWRDTLRNARALTVREVMRTPVRTGGVALSCVLAVNAVTTLYVLFAWPVPLDRYAIQWWTLLLLQFVTPLVLGLLAARLIPGREWALALTYSFTSACFAAVGMVVVSRWLSPIATIYRSAPVWALAIWGNGLRQVAFWLGCLSTILRRGDPSAEKSVAKSFVSMCVLTLISSSTLFGQTAAVPAKWTGTWILTVETSTFSVPLLPGAPTDLRIMSQTLRIEHGTEAISLSGETVYSDNSGSHTSREGNSLRLDGKPTLVGPLSLSFRRTDDTGFDVVSQLQIGVNRFEEVSRFSFSADGMTLTETKTQTQRTTTSRDDDTSGEPVKTSTSVLVFRKRAD